MKTNSRLDPEVFARQDLLETIDELILRWRHFHILIEQNAPHRDVDREDDRVDALTERLSILWPRTGHHTDPSEMRAMFTIMPIESGSYIVAGNHFAYIIEAEPQNKRWKVGLPTNVFAPGDYGMRRVQEIEHFTHLHKAINRVMAYERDVAASLIEYPEDGNA